MKTNTRRFLRLARIAIPVVLLAVPVLALAQHHGMGGPQGQGGPGHDPGAMHDRMFDRLDLTPEQRDAIDQILADNRAQTEPLREQARAAHEAVAEAIHADSFDETAIRSAAAAAAVIQEDVAVARGQVFAQIREQLTPEQLELWNEMRERMRKRMESGDGQGPGGYGRKGSRPGRAAR